MAAKSGRPEISRQTIRKILPRIDHWNFGPNGISLGFIYSYDKLQFEKEDFNDIINPKISVDELLADGTGKFPLGKLDALYKYVKHLVIPKLERDHPKEGIEKGINVIKLLLDYIKRHEDIPANRSLFTQDRF